MWQALIPLATAAVSAYSASQAQKGQERANQQGMEFNAQQASLQRDWEEKMFNERYQRTRRDLEAAGYNPLLALGGQPPVPSSAVAHADPKSTKAESSMILANTAKLVSEAALTREMVNTEKSKQELNRAQASGQVSIPGFFRAPISSASNSAKQVVNNMAATPVGKFYFDSRFHKWMAEGGRN